MGTFSIHKNLEELDVKQSLQISEFIKAAKEIGFFMLQKEGSTVSIRLSINIPEYTLDSEDYIKAVRKLACVQDITGIRIPCPLVISLEDLRCLDELINFFKKGSMQEKFRVPLPIPIEKDRAKLLLDKLDDSNPIEEFRLCSNNEVRVVCGQTIPLGSVEVIFPPMKCNKSIKELKSELDSLVDDSINIEFMPINGDSATIRQYIPKK